LSSPVVLAASSADTTFHLLVGVAVIVIVARVVGAGFRRIRQPAVVGEIIAGLLLGPSFLGLFPGELTEHLFPADVRPFLKEVANLGLALFMFMVGLELDLALLRGKQKLAATVSLSSIALPFALGVPLAFALHGRHDQVAGEKVDLLPFALFIGASMSITAFPVLARILSERGMDRIPLGALALACAAVDDVVAWSLLAVVVAVVDSAGLGDLPRILGLSLVYMAVMVFAVRPLLVRLAAWQRSRGGGLRPDVLAILLVGVLLSSAATEEIGIHFIFGAFVFGAMVPKADGGVLVHGVLERVESLTVVLLLPVFFIATGLNVNLSELGARGLGELVLILLVAIGGKLIGATAAARVQGLSTRRSTALGLLMNTRGLTELVILNIGREKGVLDEELFGLLVVMAIVTTVMTDPLLRLVYPDRLLLADLADAEAGEGGAFTVVAWVDDPAGAHAVVDVATGLAASAPVNHLLVSRFLPQPADRGRGAGSTADLAQVAVALDEVGRLSRVPADPRVAPRPGALFSADPPADAIAQATRVGADLLVTGQGSDVQAVEGAPCDAVRVQPGTARGADVVLAGADPAAVEIAGRLARAWSVPLVLARPNRRVGDRLGRTGLAVVTDEAGASGRARVVVAGVDDVGAAVLAAPGVPLVAVRSGEDADRIGLDERVDRLVLRAAPPAPRDPSGPADASSAGAH
jgi:Kef-type K+ transport system membrane component KefB